MPKSGILDLENLMKEFNLPEQPPESKPIPLELESVDPSDPDSIVAATISKANYVLDLLLEKMQTDFSPRMAEASSLLINAINNSTTQLFTKQFNVEQLKLKIEGLKLREKQLALIAGAQASGNVGSQNIIFTDRETLLKFLKDGKNNQTQLIENKKEE